jgi:hypothetical protein
MPSRGERVESHARSGWKTLLWAAPQIFLACGAERDIIRLPRTSNGAFDHPHGTRFPIHAGRIFPSLTLKENNMNDKQRRRYERVLRAQDYISADATIFPTGSKGAQAFNKLKAAIAEVETLDASRETGARASKLGTLTRTDARERLRQSVSAITRTSEVIALDDPSFKGKFKSPRSNVNDQDLLAVARSFATEALASKAKFIEYDMPADFLDELNSAIEDFEAAMNQQNQGISTRKTALALVDDALARAEEELERCDIALRNKVTDGAKITAWDSARRLEHAPRKSKAKQSPAADA